MVAGHNGALGEFRSSTSPAQASCNGKEIHVHFALEAIVSVMWLAACLGPVFRL